MLNAATQETCEIPRALIERLREARRVAVLTGAGVSAESGVPTFREAQTGLWARYNPEDLASPEAFERHPRLVWEWYDWRRQLTAGARPNPGHLALAEMQRRVGSFTLITQNVDGLHARAGSRDVIELHGNISRIKCSAGCGPVPVFSAEQSPPRCRYCGAYLRPDVVWFGEMLPLEALHRANDAAAQCEVFVTAGTSALVYPAADLPLIALRNNAMVVEVNPAETPLTRRAHCVLRGPAGAVLPELVRRCWPTGG
jgi:NAD-dependent deacetylase